jgi:penicillin-binding protein-related factor A (putative recombinase)
MTDEAEVCRVLKTSFLHQKHYLYKIPDPSNDYNRTIKRDFDMFGRYKNKSIYIEVKFLNGFKSFDLKKIEAHQYIALLEYTKIPNAICLIALGIRVSRMDNRIYFWKIQDIHNRILEQKNFHKSELESLPYYTVKSNQIKEVLELDSYINITGESHDK